MDWETIYCNQETDISYQDLEEQEEIYADRLGEVDEALLWRL